MNTNIVKPVVNTPTPAHIEMNAKQGKFSETYLKNRKITDRQLYVCGDVYEKISRYLRVIGDGKISMTSYVNNVLYQHIAEHRDIINDLYDSKVSKPL